MIREATGRVLPAISVQKAGGPTRVLRQLTARRQALLLLRLPGEDPIAVRTWLTALTTAAPRAAQHEAHVAILVPQERLDRVAALAPNTQVAIYGLDTAGQRALADLFSPSEAEAPGPWLLVADRYGEIFAQMPAPSRGPAVHQAVEQALEWLAFIALQCPE